MITLRQMHYARTLAETRNFRHASTRLNLSQPALTRSIQALEAVIGSPIFERLPQGLEPTRIGTEFLRRASVILHERRELMNEMRLWAGCERGMITVSTGPVPGHALGPQAAAAIARLVPGMKCTLRMRDWRDVKEDVVSRAADLGIAELNDASSDPRVDIELVGEDRLYFYCRPGHPLLAQTEVLITDLTAYPWAGPRTPGRIASAFNASVSPAGSLEPVHGDFMLAWTVDTIQAAMQIVGSSDVISAALLTQLEADLARKTLMLVPCSIPWLKLNNGFMTRREQLESMTVELFKTEFRRLNNELSVAEARLAARYAPSL
jgi:DNA-binding transcriptional LysR family regulator